MVGCFRPGGCHGFRRRQLNDRVCFDPASAAYIAASVRRGGGYGRMRSKSFKAKSFKECGHSCR